MGSISEMIKKNKEYSKKRDIEGRQREHDRKPIYNGIGDGKELICDECGERVYRVRVSEYGNICYRCLNKGAIEKVMIGIKEGANGWIK